MHWPFRKPIATSVRDPQPPPPPAFSAHPENGCWVIRCLATGAVVAFSDDATWALEIANALGAFRR